MVMFDDCALFLLLSKSIIQNWNKSKISGIEKRFFKQIKSVVI